MFQAPKLTDAGKNLYYRNMAGEGIKFTTIQLGNGTISGPISAMTALVSAVVTIDAAVKNNAVLRSHLRRRPLACTGARGGLAASFHQPLVTASSLRSSLGAG